MIDWIQIAANGAYILVAGVAIALALKSVLSSIMLESKRHLELQHEALLWRIKAQTIQMECVRLQKLVNRKQAMSSQFTDDEIKTLIRLCHPDKHNGAASANAITTKLLAMRK